MNKNLIWVLSFVVLTIFSVIIISDYKAEFSLAYAIEDNSNVLFYTEGSNKYNMSELLEWYEFSTVNVIFLYNESLIAKRVIVQDRLESKRSRADIKKIVESDKDLILKYPVIAKEYIKKKSSRSGSSFVPSVS